MPRYDMSTDPGTWPGVEGDARTLAAEQYEGTHAFHERAFDRVGEVDWIDPDNKAIVEAVAAWYVTTPHFADDVQDILDGELRP